MIGRTSLVRVFWLVGWLSLSASVGTACWEEDEEEGDAEPDQAPSAPVTPVSSTDSNSPNPNPAPVVPATPPPPNPSALTGPYELQWKEGAQGRQAMPATLLAQMPACIWGRWLWQFGPLGELTVQNELLCEDPTLGTGVCRAELETRVRWQQNSFVIPAPIQAHSQFTNLQPRGGSWQASGGAHNSISISCNVNLRDITATLTEVVPGAVPARPQEVTLDIGNGERIHLVATEVEVNHAEIMLRHSLNQASMPTP